MAYVLDMSRVDDIVLMETRLEFLPRYSPIFTFIGVDREVYCLRGDVG